ncbi:phosphatidylserine decarboxylase proenzyme, mitochondrial-like [Clavelina lepadiformis]|uniref:phosphatidylserine decarboxylase proenzyme, mitochondrial-like n=1 Tax=Clavelina lepadiformis TaxID=159417 RepID=UPI0040436631
MIISLTSCSRLRYFRLNAVKVAPVWTSMSSIIRKTSTLSQAQRLVIDVKLKRNAIYQMRPIFMKAMIKIPGSGENLPGQGLKKMTKEEDDMLEKNSKVLRFINRRIEAQKKGERFFPLLPDYAFFFGTIIFVTFAGLIGAIFYPDIKELLIAIDDNPTVDAAIAPDKISMPITKLYTMVPLRVLSRAWGRFMDLPINKSSRETLLKAFCWLTGANLDEALVKDLRYYKSIGIFFRRPLDPKCRPVSDSSSVVSPSDGKVLSLGKVHNGRVEQVKGITYSLQKFLGPLTEPPRHNKWGGDPSQVKNWSIAPLKQYQPALMHDPEKNDLYQCVIYLAPGDYHRFHSPVDWVMKHRRHIPGELLSVNPRIASWLQDLFVLNERVVLSGTWEHGYFSMAAIGATSVGSIKVYDDLSLKTNAVKWKRGTYNDKFYEDKGYDVKKGDPVGEFNFGSTIVLIFEAPKEMKFNLSQEQKLNYGQSIVTFGENTDDDSS